MIRCMWCVVEVVDLGDSVVSGGGSEPGCGLGDCATQGDACSHHGR